MAYIKYIQSDSKEHIILQGLNHPSIVKYIDHRILPKCIELSMEHIKGQTLTSLLFYKGKLPEEDTKRYISELINALIYVHSKNIIHGDVKLENVMVKSDGHIVLIDFGSSKIYEPNDTSVYGTLDYISPEMLHKTPHSFTIDWWSINV